MLNNLGLGLVFTAKDLASGHIQRLERNFLSMEGSITGGSDRIHASFKELGTGLTIFAAGAATLAGAYVFASAAGKFQEAIAAVGAVSNATASELQALHDAALEAGIQTQFTPTEATKGLQELAQAGFNAKESIKLLIPSLDLAAGSLGELSPEAAAGVAAQSMKAFGISVNGAGFAVDQMLQAVNVFALRAGELPLALGHAADGANALKQNLGETLIALGLIKNVIPGVERASTAAAVAMERLADPRVQKILHGIGVEVTQGKGEFRKFLDVIGDVAPKLAAMNDQQRAAFLLHAFGHHALSGVGAILTQITNGIRTEAGETLKGAEAVRYLRDQFDNAGGAAANFRDKMLDTFEGQKKLLRGSLETLSIVLGEPMAAAFKPIVTTITTGLNAVLGLIKSTPEPVKRLFATLTLVAGTFLTLVGGVLAAQGAIAVLSIGGEALGVTFGAIVQTLGVAIAVLGVLGLVVAGLRVAWDRNLGGIADKVTRVGEVISLFFKGVSQLIEQGGVLGRPPRRVEPRGELRPEGVPRPGLDDLVSPRALLERREGRLRRGDYRSVAGLRGARGSVRHARDRTRKALRLDRRRRVVAPVQIVSRRSGRSWARRSRGSRRRARVFSPRCYGLSGDSFAERASRSGGSPSRRRLSASPSVS